MSFTIPAVNNHATTNGSSRAVTQAAYYARVSSERQADEATIESQVAAIHVRITLDGLPLEEVPGFLDDGVSGATLTRPSLERLRDAVYEGDIQRLYIHSPDRLARKYAYQVLLVDEFRRCGVDIVFLNRAIGTSPEEDLFLQMQGMFSEYERAKILERSRRGKRHAAQRGLVNVLSGAPYGYRYIAKRDGGPASYELVSEQATIVQQIFEWVGRDRMSISEVCRRLKQQGTPSPSGKSSWNRSSVWNLLKNTAFCGRAIFGKTRVGERRPQLRPARGRSKTFRSAGSTYETSVTEQIVIAVPAIVGEELFAVVQEQLKANQQVARERCRGARYLLQGLVKCGCCQYAYYGNTIRRSTTNGKTQYGYYRCTGTDAHRFGGERVCQNKHVRIEMLDDAIWRDVKELIRDPKLLRNEYERRLQTPTAEASHERTLRQQEKTARNAINRLIDAFAEGLLDKSEFESRVTKARERAQRHTQELAQLNAKDAEQANLRAALNCLDEFTSHIRNGLDNADWTARREIIRLLVERICIEPEQIRIVYRISFPLFLQTAHNSTNFAPQERILQFCSRRVSPRIL